MTSALGCSCSSSTKATNTFNPSIFDVSADSGLNHEAVAITARLFVVFTIRAATPATRPHALASENTIRAWSRVSQPSRFRARLLFVDQRLQPDPGLESRLAVLPPVETNAVRNRLISIPRLGSMIFHPKIEPITNCSQSSSSKGCFAYCPCCAATPREKVDRALRRRPVHRRPRAGPSSRSRKCARRRGEPAVRDDLILSDGPAYASTGSVGGGAGRLRPPLRNARPVLVVVRLAGLDPRARRSRQADCSETAAPDPAPCSTPTDTANTSVAVRRLHDHPLSQHLLTLDHRAMPCNIRR